MTIPIELTEFVPEKIDPPTFHCWELKETDGDDNIEIRNVIFSGDMKKGICGCVIFMVISFIIFFAFILFLSPPFPIKLLIIGTACIAWLLTTLIFIAVWYGESSSGEMIWKEGLRFRYTKSTGELFFPHENVRYSRSDYNELFFGITNGYDTVKMLEEMKKDAAERTEITQRFDPVTQSYFLVRQKNGTWNRHPLAYDRHSNSIHRIATKIKRALQCSTVKRNMSMQECYATQFKTAIPGLDPRPKMPTDRLGDVLNFGFLLLFGLMGLGFIGYGLWYAEDEPTGAIILGTMFFAMSVIFFAILLLVSNMGNPAAPYTPSEPVFD